MNELEDAINFHRSGELDKAKEIYLKLLELNPDSTDILNLTGVLCFHQRNTDEAQKYLLHAYNLKADANTSYNLGLVFYEKQDFQNAAKYFEHALIDEKDTELLKTIANCYKNCEDFLSAEKYFEKLYIINPENPEYKTELASLYTKNNQIEKAVEFYQNNLKQNKKDYIACNNLGLLYEKLKDNKKAKEFYQKSLNITQNYEANHNLGILLRKEKKYQESIKCLKDALKLKPDDPKTELSLGMSYLIAKDFYNGFKHYKNKNPEYKQRYKNEWNGTPQKDKTVLVYCKGGFGDYIMFSRYLPLLETYFSQIILQIPKELESLFNKNFPKIQTVLNPNTTYDISVSLLDIPYILKTDFEHTPKLRFTYDENLSYEYSQKYFDTHSKKIGLFWRGNQKVFKNRSIKLKELEPLFSLSDVQFYSFQKDDDENQLISYPFITDIGKILRNFSDTAAALSNIETLITIDSAIAHLGGALGIKTLLMLPYANEWRWFDDEKTTIWYDSVQLVRQKEEGSWGDVVKKVYEQLTEF